MFWHAIRVEVCICLSTPSSDMNFNFLISEGMFLHAIKVGVCIFSQPLVWARASCSFSILGVT